MARGESYKEFVEKFKPKKTTDDCYTPPEIWDVIVRYVKRMYGVCEGEICRPFYQGGDYEKEDYSGKIVVDNPPFSIISKKITYYLERDIKFFLFIPHLTAFSATKGRCCTVLAGHQVRYENGAKVNTSFATNLEGGIFVLDAELRKELRDAQKANTQTKVEFPRNFVTAARLTKYIQSGRIKCTSGVFARGVNGKQAFGAGIWVSNQYIDTIEKAAEKAAEKYQVSDSEKEILRKLNKKE